MSDGTKALIARSAKLFNKAAEAFYNYPEAEEGFVPEPRDLVRKYNHERPYGPAPRFCYAPFSNIFFNTEGRAIICCKNTKVVLGQYPDNSLHDIWFGENTALLRKYILHHDLSFGCYKCREALHSGNFGAMTSTGFDFVRAWPESAWPRLLEFELSNACNLECEMCSGRVSSAIRKHREQREPLKMLYDQDFVQQLGEFIPHLKQARFYGGEPFLIDLYFDIWNAMITANPDINLYVLTNGTILNDRVKAVLERGNFNINVSMDSFQKERYESIRKNAVFEETLEHLHFFRGWMKKKKKKLTLFITPTRLNWEEIPDMVAQCDQWAVEVYFSTAFFPDHLALWNLAPARLDEMIGFYMKHQPATGVNSSRFGDLIRELEYWASEQRRDPGFKNKFAEVSAQQETLGTLINPVIRLCDAGVYKKNFFGQLAAGGMDPGELQHIGDGVDHYIEISNTEPALIYFFLMQVNPADFMEKFSGMSEAAVVEFLKDRQQQLLNTHEIVR